MQTREVRLAAVASVQLLGFDRDLEEDAEGALALLDRVSGLVSRSCTDHRGRLVRSVRDSYLAEFPTAVEAVSCSVAIQEAAVRLASGGSPPPFLAIGVHIGDVHFLENDAAGETVAIASRLRSEARPGTVLMSGEVFANVSDKLSVPIARRSEFTMEGNRRTVRSYEIDTGSGPSKTPPTGEPSAADGVADEQDFEELKTFVLNQIKRVGRRLSTEKVRRMIPSRSPELDQAIEKLADMGFLSRNPAASAPTAPTAPPLPEDRRSRFAEREAWREAKHAIREAARRSRHEYRHGHHSRPPAEDDAVETEGFAAYRERVIERAHKAVGGFAGHLVPFVVVNGLLFFINLSTGFTFPWFLFPLGGWGIGLISHFTSVWTARRERTEVAALPEDLSDEDFRHLRKFHRARASVRATLASTLSVAAFLLMINMIVSPGFLWAIFPIAGLFIAIVSSATTYLSRRGSFRKRLDELFRRKGGGESQAASPSVAKDDDPPVVRQAVVVASSILEHAKQLDPAKAYLGEDLEPLLENYIGQIRTLAHRKREVEEIMAAVPRAELNRDLDALRQRFAQAPAGALKEEYRKSIEQIERQNRSFEELQGQQELLDLRVAGSLNSLKQMQIDLVRVGGLGSTGDLDSVGRLRDKSRELSDYLHDLSESYEELEGLRGSGERERKHADRLLAEFIEREKRSAEEQRSE